MTDIDLDILAKQLRSDGYDAGALLIEMGVLQRIFDFSKRAKAENIQRADQVDALAKLFASVIMPFASGIPDPVIRMKVIIGIMDVIQGHVESSATEIYRNG